MAESLCEPAGAITQQWFSSTGDKTMRKQLNMMFEFGHEAGHKVNGYQDGPLQKCRRLASTP